MNLEHNLEFLNEKRKKYHSIRYKQGVIYSGIKSIDDLTNGLNRQKIYSFVAKKGNGLYSLISTLAENIDVLYQTNYSVIAGKVTQTKRRKFIRDRRMERNATGNRKWI